MRSPPCSVLILLVLGLFGCRSGGTVASQDSRGLASDTPDDLYGEFDKTQRDELFRRQKLWGADKFTSPRDFAKSENFMFLVHGYSGLTKDGEIIQAEGVYSFLTEGLKEKPTYIVSTSVIGKLDEVTHTGFYGCVGFIFKVNPSRVLATGNSDIGTMNEPSIGTFPIYLQMHYDMNGIQSPEEILANTREMYNEVAYLGPGVQSRSLPRENLIQAVIIDEGKLEMQEAAIASNTRNSTNSQCGLVDRAVADGFKALAKERGLCVIRIDAKEKSVCH